MNILQGSNSIIKRRMTPEIESKLFGMRGYPGGLFEDRGIDQPFLLFVGRREKRKDLGTLLAAFDELLAAGGAYRRLVDDFGEDREVDA